MADSNPPLGSPKSSGEAEVDGGAAQLRNTADSSAASAGAAPQKAGEGAATQGAPAVEGRADGVISRGTAKPASTGGAAGSPVAAVSTTRAERPKASLLNLLCTVFAIGSIFGALLLTLWLYKPMTKAWNNTRAPDHPSENVFDLGLGDGKTGTFPFLLKDKATVDLSVIVPAYNEEKRIPEERGIDDMIAFLTERQARDPANTWEIIIVDDGSKDGTSDLVLREYVAKQGSDKVRLLKCAKNGGKGAAVRKGMLRARGRRLLMADADGATDIKAFEDLNKALKSVATKGRGPKAFALGSRAHLKKARSAVRQFFSRGFHFVISLLLGGQSIQDTQCGFKLFTRAAAKDLFSQLHIERWAFDVELVYIASRMGVPTVEVPVPWHEVGGSKLDPTSASIEMLRDIIVIRLAYLFGLWKIV